MLRDLAGDVIASLLGDAFLGWLLPDRWKVPSAPPEGDWNASLGSVAALSGVLAPGAARYEPPPPAGQVRVVVVASDNPGRRSDGTPAISRACCVASRGTTPAAGGE